MTVFPGDRRVWLAGGAVFAVLAVVALVALLSPRESYTGTNSVRVRSPVGDVAPGKALCLRDVTVPAGTGRIEVGTPLVVRPQVRATFTGGGERLAGSATAVATPGYNVVVPVPRTARAATGTLCLTPRQGTLQVGGMAGLQSDMRPGTYAGKPFANRVALWFRPPAGHERTLASLLPQAWARASRFRPGWVGPWTYGALLLVVAPLAAYAALRLVAVTAAGGRTRIPTAVAVGLVAFANCATWATLTPNFDSPDEMDHFAYVQTVAETGHKVNSFGVADRAPLSTEETLAVDAVRLLSMTEASDGRPPWTAADEARWAARAKDPPKDNGGGITTAASHSPAYYALMSPAYLVASGSTIWSELWAVRLMNALLGALVAAFGFLFIRELLPGRPTAAVAGGLLIAFLPQFTFISGAVNNDNGVNAAAAASLWLVARALRRGLDWRTGAGLALTLTLLPLFKQTGFALYPALAVALLGALWRRHDRTALTGLATLVAGALVLRVLWSVTGGAIDTVSAPPTGGGGPVVTAGSTVTSALDNPTLLLSYFWQTFLPKLPFMTDLFHQQWPAFGIYGQRGVAALGWYAVGFPKWVYLLVLAVLFATVALALRGLWVQRASLRTRWWEVAVVVLAVGGVLGGVAAAYVSAVPHALGQQPEQGRYAFTVLAAVAAVVAFGISGARRWAPWVAGTLVAGMAGLQIATQLLGYTGFFT